MRSLGLGLALLALALPALAAPPSPQPARPSQAAQAASSAVLPSFCIPAKIGSHGPFLLGFDTGISPSTVTPALVERLKLPILGEVQVTDASDTGHHSAYAVRLDGLAALGSVFPPHLAVVVPSRERGCAEPLSGTLGMSLFRDHVLTVDLRAGTLDLAAPGQGRLTEEDPHTLPYRLERSLPMVKIAVGPSILRAGIDTGGQFGIILPTSFAKKLPMGPVLATGQMRTVVGQFPFKQAQLYGTLVVGGNDVQAPIISFSDHFPIAIMGRHLLARFLLTFDQRSRLVRIEPRAAFP